MPDSKMRSSEQTIFNGTNPHVSNQTFKWNMEIISIEKKTFEEMISKFDSLIAKAEALFLEDKDRRASEWLDSQDVCILLNISQRTLQTLRDSGRLAYSQINHKTYYLPEDVERMLSVVKNKRKNDDKR